LLPFKHIEGGAGDFKTMKSWGIQGTGKHSIISTWRNGPVLVKQTKIRGILANF